MPVPGATPDAAGANAGDRSKGRKKEMSAEELLASLNRGLPFSDDAEKAVLSCILQDPVECLSECRASVKPNTFYHDGNRTIYEVLCGMYDQNLPIDLILLTQKLREQKLLDRVGGPAAVSELLTFAPVTSHFSHYRSILQEKETLRRMIHACSESIHEAHEFGRQEEGGDITQLMDRIESRVLDVNETEQSGKEKTISQHVMDAIEDIDYMTKNPGVLRGISSGYSKLDHLTSGLQAGEMFVVAARPSMGKTSLAMNIVEHIAVDQDRPCAVFSLEMSAAMLVRRLLVSRAMLSMQELARGVLSRAQMEAIGKASRELQRSKIFIDETPGLDIMELRAKARRLKKQHNIQFIAIDYLQLLRSGSRRAQDNRQIEIAEISAGIKGLSKELSLPIMVLAQLNRSVEQRKGQRPVLSDLRESGSIEQDADMVGLLTRADYAGGKMEVEDKEKEEEKKGQAMLILAKNRNGPTNDVHLRFIDHAMRFVEREPTEEEKAEG
ncbi:MAG: replicative DNA helicase [Verrucomicrobiales bacterium]|nr:replicative DNA helicase [Verrucomicrobiales bacterium]